MWPNPQETPDLVTFIEEIVSRKLHILCSDIFFKIIGIKVDQNFFVKQKDGRVSLFMNDDFGSKVVLYLLLRKDDPLSPPSVSFN